MVPEDTRPYRPSPGTGCRARTTLSNLYSVSHLAQTKSGDAIVLTIGPPHSGQWAHRNS